MDGPQNVAVASKHRKNFGVKNEGNRIVEIAINRKPMQIDRDS